MMNKFLEKMKGAKALPLLLLAAVLCLALCLMPEEPKGAMTEEEMRISRTLSRIQGAGECAVSIWYENETGAFGSGEKRPSGIIILSQGAQDLSVRLQLMQAAQTLLGIDAGHVAVFQMEEEK